MKDSTELGGIAIPASFAASFAQAASVVNQRSGAGETALVIHHNDADGITSGAILSAALQRCGYRPTTCSLEKPYPELLPQIYRKAAALYVYGDLGSAYIDAIASAADSNDNVSPTILVDHHLTGPSPTPKVLNVNGELHGLSGSLDISGASTCLLFALALDETNIDLASLAVIGSFEIPGPLRSVNAAVLAAACDGNMVTTPFKSASPMDPPFRRMGPDGERWRESLVGLGADRVPVGKAFSDLETCGAVGYYLGGSEVALSICRRGYGNDELEFLAAVELRRQKAFRDLDSAVASGETVRRGKVCYLDAGFALEGLGAKVIGSYLTCLVKKPAPDRDKNCYLIASMPLVPDVPHLGRLPGSQVKFSGRVFPELAEDILSGGKPSLEYLFSEAAARCGGYGDGHKVAASAVVPASKRLDFVSLVDELSLRK